MQIQVPPSGIREAKIAIITDYPEDEEISRGVAFPSSGRYGRHLGILLQNVVINRGELYFTSLFKNKPPRTFIIKDKLSKTILKYDDYWTRAKEFYAELESIKANVLVPMGDASLFALANQWGLEDRRGSIYAGIDAIQGRKVIGTLHPKRSIKQFEINYSILADLSRIKEQSKFPEVITPQIDHITQPTYTEACAYLKLCMTKPWVSFDIETSHQEIRCISFSYKVTEGISIPFVWRGFPYYTDQEEAYIWFLIGQLLENPKIKKLTQNGTYDTTVILAKFGIRCHNLGDTMIQHAVLYPELKKDLGFITSTQTEVPYHKDDAGFKKCISFATDIDMARYNIKDSVVLSMAYPKLEANLIKQGNQETCDYQTRLVPILAYMNTLGMRMDAIGLKKAKHNALIKRDEAKAKILEFSEGIITNPNSHAQLKKYFYGVLGIKPIRAKGSVTVDDPALKKIHLMGYKIASRIQDYRHHSIYASQFYGVVLGDDNRFRNSTNPVGTLNGRFSSSENFEGEGTNAQNMPEKLKRFVLADKGYLLYDFDLAQAESRIVAYIAPEPAMIEVFEKGIDAHARTASMLCDLTIEEILIEDKANIHCTFGNGQHTWRYWGKQLNHSLAYNMGYKTFAHEKGILEKDAKKIINIYHNGLPGIKRYHSWVEDELGRTNNTLVNNYGRHRKFMGRGGGEMYRKAYNFIPQSTVADKINREGLIFLYERQDLFKPVELLNQVHDSIVLQIPISLPLAQHAEIVHRLRESLETEISWMARKFKIPLDAKVGFNLGKNNKETNPEGMLDIDISNNISTIDITQNLTTAYERLMLCREN